jgi:hypothetical protein
MKPAGWFLTLVSGVGLLAIAAPNAISQTSTHELNPYAASEPATYEPVKEAVPVQAALNQFDDALARHDVGMLEAAGVKRADAKRWREFFRENPHATVTDRCSVSDLFISDESASWTCTETATIISEGKPRSFVHVIRFTFARNNGNWIVAERR